MIFTLILKIFELFFLYFPLFLASKIPINFIWGSFSAKFTFFSGILPAFFGVNGATFFYVTYFLGSGFFILKIPGMIYGMSFSLFEMKKNNYIRMFFSVFLSFAVFLFVFYFKRTFFYTIPWVCIALWLLIRSRSKLFLFERSFIASWIGHASGTLIYGMIFDFLTNNEYLLLLPISICERFLFSFSLTLFVLYQRGVSFCFSKLKQMYPLKGS